MFFSWLRHFKRNRILAGPFPDEWEKILVRNVRHCKTLSDNSKRKLRDDLRIFVAAKNWEGCRGLELNDEIKVTIAAQIAILTLGFESEYFDMVQSILVYPDAYVAPGQQITKGGVVIEGDSSRQGEAWYRGPVILSWADALAGGLNEADGHNLVFHEFAHQLDMQNGRVVDGTPPLSNSDQFDRWQTIIHLEYARLVDECDRGVPTLLGPYGTTNIGEFFAVSTECFFERPAAMKQRHREWYVVMAEYFNQDLCKTRQ